MENKKDANGNYYISTQAGQCYLDFEKFQQINNSVEFPPFAYGIEIKDTVNDAFLIVSGEYYPWNEEMNSYLGTEKNYLCNIDGSILFPEINYQWVSRTFDQYNAYNKQYLRLFNSNESIDEYFDLTTGEILTFPENYQNADYKYDSYFLLNNGNNYCIYLSLIHI